MIVVKTIVTSGILALSDPLVGISNDDYIDAGSVETREQREEWDIWAYPEEGIEEGNEYYY